MEYEKAAQYRDSLLSLNKLEESQKATTESGDRDVIGLAVDDTGVCLEVFFVRNGKILGRDSFFLDDEKGNPQQKSSLLSLGNIIRKSIGPPRKSLRQAAFLIRTGPCFPSGLRRKMRKMSPSLSLSGALSMISSSWRRKMPRKTLMNVSGRDDLL